MSEPYIGAWPIVLSGGTAYSADVSCGRGGCTFPFLQDPGEWPDGQYDGATALAELSARVAAHAAQCAGREP